MSDKELIWVPKELAEEFNKLDSMQAQEKLVKDLINKKGLDLTYEQEILSENLLMFKSFCLAHKNALQKVYDEEEEKLEKLFDETNNCRASLRDSAEKLANQIRPVREELNSISREIRDIQETASKVNIYQLDRFMEFIDKFNNMDRHSLKMIKFLFEKFETKETT